MKYAKAILVTIAVGVLLDILIDATIPDPVMNVVFIVVASVVLLGVLLVSVGTVRRNHWGINFERVNCPACGSPMPRVRQPKSQRQALWGDWTCAKCGCEVDKWGRLITRAPMIESKTMRVRADFNGLFGELLCLSHKDTCEDEDGNLVTLHAGMVLTAFDEDVDEHGNRDDLIVSGTVEPSPKSLRCLGSRWVLRMDRNGVRHESDLGSTPKRYKQVGICSGHKSSCGRASFLRTLHERMEISSQVAAGATVLCWHRGSSREG